jgi:hypothetical protein
MPFGELLTGSVKLIWRNKKLLIFPAIGLALYAIGLLIYQLAGAAWLSRYFDWLNDMMRSPDAIPPDIMGEFFTGVAAMWIGLAVFLMLSLLGYIVGLVATSGLILEADRARDGEQVDVGRGLREGLGRAGHLFLVQLAWLLPGLLIGCVGFAGFFLLAFGAGAAGSRSDTANALGFVWLACVCGGFCLGLLYAVVAGIFSPLMQQSAVAGRRGVVEAIREGWALTRVNLGTVILVWILLLLVSFAVTVLLQLVTTIISLPLTGVWLAGFGRLMEDAQRGVMPQLPRVSTPLYLITSLFSLLVTVGGMWLLQAYMPVVWNGVYRRLSRPVVAAPAELVAAEDDTTQDEPAA